MDGDSTLSRAFYEKAEPIGIASCVLSPFFCGNAGWAFYQPRRSRHSELAVAWHSLGSPFQPSMVRNNRHLAAISRLVGMYSGVPLLSARIPAINPSRRRRGQLRGGRTNHQLTTRLWSPMHARIMTAFSPQFAALDFAGCQCCPSCLWSLGKNL